MTEQLGFAPCPPGFSSAPHVLSLAGRQRARRWSVAAAPRRAGLRMNLLDGPVGGQPELPDSIKEKIDSQISGSSVVLYMKGDPSAPQCGFSQRACAMLEILGAEYNTFNVLADEDIRQGIKIFSDWPTIPQLYVDGEFVGGTDIMEQMYHSGELSKVLADAEAI